jgi:hypothetical protein
MRILIFPANLSETFLILRQTERDMIKNYIGLNIEYWLLLTDYNEAWIFWTYFLKNFSNMEFHGNLSSGCRVGSCGQTWHEEAFRSFENVLKTIPVSVRIRHNRPIPVSDAFLLLGRVCIGRIFWERIPNVGNRSLLYEIRFPCLCKYPVNSQNIIMLIS